MRKPKPRSNHTSALPDRASNPLGGLDDAGRRGFLKALAAGSGAFCVGGVGRLAGADEIPIDFARLERHRPVDPAGDPEPADDQAVDREAEELADRAADSVEADDDGSAVAEDVVENRALWVEPGYLVLLRWRRGASDTRPIDALAGATAQVGAFLASRVTSVDQIHNIDQLRAIEAELASLLGVALAPAVIEVLHLDHDCRSVCSLLDPSRMYPEPVMVDGDVVGPEWE